MANSSPPARPPSGPPIHLPSDPKRILQLLVVLLLAALLLTKFQVSLATLIAILVVGFILQLLALL